MQQGNVSALATDLTQSGTRRLWRCHTCETPFAETRATVFCDLRTSEDKGMMALHMLLVRVALAGPRLVLGGTEETGLAWLRRAAQQAATINQHLRRTLPVTQGHLDARGNFIGRTPAQETDAAGESVPDSAEGRQGVWVSLAPAFRLMIPAMVGPRTRDTATAVVAVTQARVAGIPACFRAGCTCSLAALIAACHVVTTCARTGPRGRPRKPRWEPHPEVVYRPLVKQQPQGTRLTRRTRVVVGTERLTPLGLRISTAVVARVHVPLRQALAPLVRQTSGFWKDRERLRQRVGVFQAFSKRASPHMRLQPPLAQHEQTRHGAIRPRWRQQTPAMAAGMTDHVWTFRELLTVKFEPLNSQSISG
jgi:hypothetical protein